MIIPVIPKLVMSVLTSRTLWAGLGIALFLWTAYSWAYDRGERAQAQRDRAEISRLQIDLKKTKAELQAFERLHKAQGDAHKQAMELLAKANAEEVSRLKTMLTETEARRRATQERLNHELKKLITPATDVRYLVPYGFVWFHDMSAARPGPTKTAAAESAPIPGGGRPDAGAPAPIAISAVAATVQQNYAECHAREEVIEAWQSWYTNSLSNWRKAMERQLSFSMALDPAPQLIAPSLTN